MTGHGAKLSRKMEQAVASLLTARSLEEAAKSIGVSSKTLHRWQRLPEFDNLLRTARRAAFRQSLARLQQASVPAVTTLMKVMLDPATPLAVRARCGFYILEQTRRDIETDEIEGRLAELERKVKGSESRT